MSSSGTFVDDVSYIADASGSSISSAFLEARDLLAGVPDAEDAAKLAASYKPFDVSEGTFVSNIVKEYPDMVKVVIYHKSFTIPKKQIKPFADLPPPPDWLDVSDLDKALAYAIKKDNIHRSVRRSRTSVKDIIMCNTWDFWCTFTFAPDKVDRFSYNQCATKMLRWLNRQPGLAYVVVPEQHKNGAYHFHALIANYNGTLKESGKKTKRGQTIFRGNFRGGYNEFVKLDGNKEALAKYMTKQYITKDMSFIHGRKRYYCSKGLNRPIQTLNGVTVFKLWDVLKNRKPQYMDEHLEVHMIKKEKAINLDTAIQTSLFHSLDSPL